MGENIWKEVKKILSEQISSTAMSTWFSDCEYVSFDGSLLELCAGGVLKKQIIKKKFASQIKDIMKDLLSCETELKVYSDRNEMESEQSRRNIDDMRSVPSVSGYVFDRFVVGESNKLAYSTALSVARNPGGMNLNPLFVYGGSGLGKTHLLCSIGRYVAEHERKKAVRYIKGDDLTVMLVRSIQQKDSESLRNMLRSTDVLLMDDIQFIAGKERTQEEFYNTFNALYQRGAQIVMASDRPPRELTRLEERLRSRFEGGVMAAIGRPELSLREKLFREKAMLAGLELSEADISLIVEKTKDNVRQIEGVVKSLKAYVEIMGRVTRSEIERVLDSFVDNKSPVITADRIIRQTAGYYGLKPELLTGSVQTKAASHARQTAMYLVRTMTGMSLKDIGGTFGDRNHSTVLAGINKVEQSISSDPEMRNVIEDIKLNLQNR